MARLYGRAQAIPYFNEAAALGALVLAMQFFPGGMSGSVLVAGTIGAAPLILNAVGMILIFRANRFLNFAQIQIGIFAATVFDGLYRGQLVLHSVHSACASCVGSFPGKTAHSINFVIAALAALLTAVILSLLVYFVVVRRFSRSPVLVSSIVTVFVAQALNSLQRRVSVFFVPKDSTLSGRSLEHVTPPVDHVSKLFGFPVHLWDALLVVLVPVVLVGIVVYLNRTTTGVAMRAAAENPQRASTVGVDVGAVTSRIWLIAGVLSALAALVPAFLNGVGGSDQSAVLPIATLVLLLTILVFARFVNFWMAAVAGLVLSVLGTAVQVSFSSQAPLEAAFVFIVGGLLLLQRDRSTRAAREDFSGLDVTRELRGIPAELRHLPQVKRYVRIGAVVLGVVLLGAPFAFPLSKTSLFVDAFGLSIVGLSLLVLTGWAGQVSLGQFGFASIGAWAAAKSGLPFPLAVIGAGLVGAVAAIVVGLPALKLKGLNLAISTLAFSLSARALFIDDRYFGKGLGHKTLTMPRVLGVNFGDERVTYYLTFGIVLAFIFVVMGLRRTRTGRALIALRANEATAQSFGINALRARLTAFSVSGFMAAVAGALLAFHLGQVAPAAFAPDKSLTVFLFTVLGGLGGIAGPLLGMGFYTLVALFSSNALIQYLGGGLGAVFLMLVAPGGVAELAYRGRDAMLRRLAIRLRIPVPSLMGDRGAALSADRIVLDEKREGPRRLGEPVALSYKPDGQWALDRLGNIDGQERVGVH